jgi:hypothetical protein
MWLAARAEPGKLPTIGFSRQKPCLCTLAPRRVLVVGKRSVRLSVQRAVPGPSHQ